MMTRTASRKVTSSAFLQEAQTLFVTSQPSVRYAIATVLVSIAVGMMMFVPNFDMTYAVAYMMAAAVYGWELSLALAIMGAIFGFFKLLATLPLAVAIILVAVIFIYAGV